MFERFRQRTVTILSVDGGGIRGLIPSMVLSEIDQIRSQMGREGPLHRCFDLMAGTSTGALVVLGLSIPRPDGDGKRNGAEPVFTPRKLVDMYLNEGKRIFPPDRSKGLHQIAHALKRKYDGTAYRQFLEEWFDDATMEDALTNLIIPSYDMERMRPHFFKKRPRRGHWKHDPVFAVKDVAMATSSAPTYFEPAVIEPVDGNTTEFSLIDGGIFASNPALIAYTEAKKIFPRAERFRIVSVGTGRLETSYPRDEVSGWGVLEWLAPNRGMPLLAMMIEAQSETCLHSLSKYPDVEVFRFDISISDEHLFLDDTTHKNMRYLRERGDELLRSSRDTIRDLCRNL